MHLLKEITGITKLQFCYSCSLTDHNRYLNTYHHHHHHHHHHHISVMELGHLLTRSGLKCPEASSKVCCGSFCQWGSRVSLPWVIYYEAFCLHVVFSFSCSLNICFNRNTYGSQVLQNNGVRGGAIGWGTALQTGRSRVRLTMVPLEFFIDIILPAALWPWVDTACKRNEYRNISCGVKATGAQGWQLCHLHVPSVLKSGSLNLLETSGPDQVYNGIALPFYLYLITKNLIEKFMLIYTRNKEVSWNIANLRTLSNGYCNKCGIQGSTNIGVAQISSFLRTVILSWRNLTRIKIIRISFRKKLRLD
jgi:hypothetical protein